MQLALLYKKINLTTTAKLESSAEETQMWGFVELLWAKNISPDVDNLKIRSGIVLIESSIKWLIKAAVCSLWKTLDFEKK